MGGGVVRKQVPRWRRPRCRSERTPSITLLPRADGETEAGVGSPGSLPLPPGRLPLRARPPSWQILLPLPVRPHFHSTQAPTSPTKPRKALRVTAHHRAAPALSCPRGEETESPRRGAPPATPPWQSQNTQPQRSGGRPTSHQQVRDGPEPGFGEWKGFPPERGRAWGPPGTVTVLPIAPAAPGVPSVLCPAPLLPGPPSPPRPHSSSPASPRSR